MFETRTYVLVDPPAEIFALTPADGFAPLLFVLAVVLIRQSEPPARLWLFMAVPMLAGFILGLDTSVYSGDTPIPQELPPEVASSLSTGFLGFSGLILLGGAGLLALQTALGALFHPRLARLLCLPVVLLPLVWTVQKLTAATSGEPSPLSVTIGSAVSLAVAVSVALLVIQFLVSLLRRINGPAAGSDS